VERHSSPVEEVALRSNAAVWASIPSSTVPDCGESNGQAPWPVGHLVRRVEHGRVVALALTDQVGVALADLEVCACAGSVEATCMVCSASGSSSGFAGSVGRMPDCGVVGLPGDALPLLGDGVSCWTERYATFSWVAPKPAGTPAVCPIT
jgi:hypothetical protein